MLLRKVAREGCYGELLRVKGVAREGHQDRFVKGGLVGKVSREG